MPNPPHMHILTCDCPSDKAEDEYGVCACSHGKSDHNLHAEHPACYECPYEQSHHAFVAE